MFQWQQQLKSDSVLQHRSCMYLVHLFKSHWLRAWKDIESSHWLRAWKHHKYALVGTLTNKFYNSPPFLLKTNKQTGYANTNLLPMAKFRRMEGNRNAHSSFSTRGSELELELLLFPCAVRKAGLTRLESTLGNVQKSTSGPLVVLTVDMDVQGHSHCASSTKHLGHYDP